MERMVVASIENWCEVRLPEVLTLAGSGDMDYFDVQTFQVAVNKSLHSVRIARQHHLRGERLSSWLELDILAQDLILEHDSVS